MSKSKLDLEIEEALIDSLEKFIDSVKDGSIRLESVDTKNTDIVSMDEKRAYFGVALTINYTQLPKKEKPKEKRTATINLGSGKCKVFIDDEYFGETDEVEFFSDELAQAIKDEVEDLPEYDTCEQVYEILFQSKFAEIRHSYADELDAIRVCTRYAVENTAKVWRGQWSTRMHR